MVTVTATVTLMVNVTVAVTVTLMVNVSRSEMFILATSMKARVRPAGARV